MVVKPLPIRSSLPSQRIVIDDPGNVTAHVATISRDINHRHHEVAPDSNTDIHVAIAGLREAPQELHADVVVALEVIPQTSHLGQATLCRRRIFKREHLDEELRTKRGCETMILLSPLEPILTLNPTTVRPWESASAIVVIRYS